MGKNQEKRQAKRIKHARSVWAKKQIVAANFWKSLNEAEAKVMEHADEFSEEDMLTIQAQVHEQRVYIKDYVLKARDNFVAAVGEEVAADDFDFSDL